MSVIYLPERSPVVGPGELITRPWLQTIQTIAADLVAAQGEITSLAARVAALEAEMAALGVWQTYAAAWSSAGVSQPDIGDGTLTSRYMEIGNTVLFYIGVAMGATTTYGAGAWRFTLPRNALLNPIGMARYNDTGTGTHLGAWFGAASQITLFTNASPVAAVTATSPFAWASGDFLFAMGEYEAVP